MTPDLDRELFLWYRPESCAKAGDPVPRAGEERLWTFPMLAVAMIGMQIITDSFLPLYLHSTVWILLNDLYFEKAPVPNWASQVAQ